MKKILILILFLAGCGYPSHSQRYYEAMAKMQDSSYTFKERQKAWQEMHKHQWEHWKYMLKYYSHLGIWR